MKKDNFADRSITVLVRYPAVSTADAWEEQTGDEIMNSAAGYHRLLAFQRATIYWMPEVSCFLKHQNPHLHHLQEGPVLPHLGCLAEAPVQSR